MRQQINLYQPIASEERKALSAGAVVIAVGVIGAALIAWSSLASMRVASLEATVEELRVQQSQQEAALADTQQSEAALAKSAAIDARLKKLTVDVAQRENALKVLQSGAAGQTTGFAARMEALAHPRVAGIWIDRMVFSGTNGTMSLSGAALTPELVPAYLRGLALEKTLAGTRFDEFVIERPQLKTTDAVEPPPEAATKSRAPDVTHIRFRAGSKSLPNSSVEPI